MLIGITGAKGSGKDTLGEFYRGRNFYMVKNAEPLKNMLRSLYRDAQLDEETIERKIEGDLKETPCEILCGKTPRFAMQTLGQEWREMIGTTLWTRIAEAKSAELLKDGTPVVCTDIRYQHEADFVRRLGGYIIRVIRPGTGEEDTHASETEMKNLEIDYLVSNLTTINDLHKQGKWIFEHITGQRV